MIKNYHYKLEVLPDTEGNKKVFTILSPVPIDSRILQICGLYLDGGCPPEIIRSEVPTAQAYVSACSSHKEEWIDDALKGLI